MATEFHSPRRLRLDVVQRMGSDALHDDCLSSAHGERHFERIARAQISGRYSDQTILRDGPQCAAVLREGDDMIGYPGVVCEAQMGTVYFPDLQTAAASLRTGSETAGCDRCASNAVTGVTVGVVPRRRKPALLPFPGVDGIS